MPGDETRSYGWSADRRRHVLPGRLLLFVPGLRHNPALGRRLAGRLHMCPAVSRARPNIYTGRILVVFHPNEMTASELEGAVLDEAETTAGLGEVAAGQENLGTSAETPWHARSAQDVLYEFATPFPSGIEATEAALRLTRHGKNELVSRAEKTLAAVVWDQLKSPMSLLLFGTGSVSLVAAKWLEALTSIGIAAVSALVGVTQEQKTRRALVPLNHLAAPRANVLRDGRECSIDARSVVAGDILVLRGGDRVAADARIIASAGIEMDESALTGESSPVKKESHPIAESTLLPDRNNMAYAGTTVVSGRAEALVVATGMATELGKLAAQLEQAGRGKTPMQVRLERFTRGLSLAVLGVSFISFLLGSAKGMGSGSAFTLATGVAMTALPQGLPITVGIALSTATARLARRGALARDPGAVETLGSTTVICCDKTGTLTHNRLQVKQVFASESTWERLGDTLADVAFSRNGVRERLNEAAKNVLKAASLCSAARALAEARDPMERATFEIAEEIGIDVGRLHQQKVHHQAFSSEKRRMSVLCPEDDEPSDRRRRLYVKGAPEEVLASSQAFMAEEGIRPMSGAERRRLSDRAEEMASEGLRVVGVAQGVDRDSENLVFLGFIGFMDTPRKSAKRALARCRRAGVRLLILTGDHPATAKAVAKDLGVLTGDRSVLTGWEIDAMSDEELRAALKTANVCARVTPEHKLRLVRLLKTSGEVVAMAGDGVNDAPALKEASVGIAMGVSGTDVTKGAANVVLAEDDLERVVDAVLYGRGAFSNIRKALTYNVATNTGEALLTLVPLALGLPIPVPLAALLVTNAICDGWSNLSLAAAEPATNNIERTPRPPAGALLDREAVKVVSLRSGWIVLSTLGLFAIGTGLSGVRAVGHSMALAGLVATKILFARQLHTNGGHRPREGNALLRVAALLGTGTAAACIYLPSARRLLRTAPLNPGYLAVVCGVVGLQHGLAAVHPKRRVAI